MWLFLLTLKCKKLLNALIYFKITASFKRITFSNVVFDKNYLFLLIESKAYKSIWYLINKITVVKWLVKL